MQHCTPPGDCSVEHRYYMLYAIHNIVPLLVIAHPVQPGDGGTSWRLEEYITPCQHILAEYIAEHIGGYITNTMKSTWENIPKNTLKNTPHFVNNFWKKTSD